MEYVKKSHTNTFFSHREYIKLCLYQIIELTDVAMVCLSPTKMMRTMLLRPTPTTPRSDWRTQRLESPWLSGFEYFCWFEVWVILPWTTATLQLLPRRIRRARTLKCFIILNVQLSTVSVLRSFQSALILKCQLESNNLSKKLMYRMNMFYWNVFYVLFF